MKRCPEKYVVIFLSLLLPNTEALGDFNDTGYSPNFIQTVDRNGREIFITTDLMKKLTEQEETWHYTPWLRTRIEVIDNIVREVNCLARDSVASFPDSLFTKEQLRRGAFILYALFGIYAFTLLAIVCNDFFIPCVELICEDLKIPQNVAAATFMAVATSCPEFFVNVISTFLTKSDMGIGTIIGSALFNALGVAAVGGLAAIKPIVIESRPVTRDVIIYMINVSVLVIFVWDGQIDWYESLVLGILYILYFIVMFNSHRLFTCYDKIVDFFCRCLCKRTKSENSDANSNAHPIEDGISNKGYEDTNDKADSSPEKDNVTEKAEEFSDEKPKKSLFQFPGEKSLVYRIWWLYSWPLKLILGITIPSPVTCRKFYPLAFIMCIIWIGANSYLVSWSMSVIGDTFFIPDSVMGMTFLAFGGCLPEACSIFIMSRRGEGGIGVSNALGANSLAILFALGLPWLIRTVSLEIQGAANTAVMIDSDGIDLVVGSLLVAVTCLWIVLFIGKFTLRRSLGAVMIVFYVIFITFAILVETGSIFERILPYCLQI